MSGIRSKDTKLDIAMMNLLERNRISFERYPKMYGNPDFLIQKQIALFCDSSFWHGRCWERLKKQLARGSNAKYWIDHIETNRRRDRKVTAILKKSGVKVLRVWDKDILKSPDTCIDKVNKMLESI